MKRLVFAALLNICASLVACGPGSDSASTTPASSGALAPIATGKLSAAECKAMIDRSIHLMTDGVNGDPSGVALISNAHQAGLDRCTKQSAFDRGNYNCVMAANGIEALVACDVDFMSNVKF